MTLRFVRTLLIFLDNCPKRLKTDHLNASHAVMGSRQAGKALGFGPSIRRFESCLPSVSVFAF